jgi:hypothetical protein
MVDPARWGPCYIPLRVGCLEQRDELVPTKQQWCQSALRWAMDLSDIQKLSRQ